MPDDPDFLSDLARFPATVSALAFWRHKVIMREGNGFEQTEESWSPSSTRAIR
jgi:hypothetical protein